MNEQEKREKVIKGLEICSAGEWNSTGGRDHTNCPYYPAGYTGCTCKLLMRDALALLKAQEPRVMTLEVAKEARTCWIEERDVGIVYPAIYECIGNRSKYGQFSVFTVVSDADIIPEEFDDDDDLVCAFEEGRRWLWESDYNDVWRCWTEKPTDEQRRETPWQ